MILNLLNLLNPRSFLALPIASGWHEPDIRWYSMVTFKGRANSADISADLGTLCKQPHNYGKSQFLMGKSTISMAHFNSYVKLPEGSSQFGMMQLSP